jgi:hypothetical protein
VLFIVEVCVPVRFFEFAAAMQLCQLEGMDEPSISLKESFALHCGHRFCNNCWTAGVGQAVVRWCCCRCVAIAGVILYAERFPAFHVVCVCVCVQSQGLAVVNLRCFSHNCKTVGAIARLRRVPVCVCRQGPVRRASATRG